MAPARSDIRATLTRDWVYSVDVRRLQADAVERHRFPSNGLKALNGGRNARPNGVLAPVEVEAVTARRDGQLERGSNDPGDDGYCARAECGVGSLEATVDKDDFEACESAIAAAECAFERGLEAAKEAGRQEVLAQVREVLRAGLFEQPVADMYQHGCNVSLAAAATALGIDLEDKPDAE